MKKLYLAYGSNLNKGQMSMRCPGAEPVGRAVLHGWRLEFRRVLTIVPDENATVEGGLWRITAEDEEALDRYEGFPGWYDKHLIRLDDSDELVMTYVLDKGQPALPSDQYLRTCVKGCIDFGIDPAVMFQALKDLERGESLVG